MAVSQKYYNRAFGVCSEQHICILRRVNIYDTPCAATVQQPGQATTNVREKSKEKVCCFAGMFSQLRTVAVTSCFSDKEEVLGSSPGKPTL